MIHRLPLVIKVTRFLAITVSIAAILCSDFAFAQTFVDRQSANSFRVANYNVYFDELFRFASRGELIRFVNAVDADVYAFQEAFATSASQARDLFNEIAPLTTGSWQVHRGRNQLIISRYGLSLQKTNVPNGTRGIAMAQVDLPDEHFFNDIYILNNHFPCCDSNESQRIAEAFSVTEWIADALTVGGNVDLVADTAVAVVGDLNTVSGFFPRDILLDGFGNFTTDWDGSSMTDANPTHNAAGLVDYTWRDDTSPFAPGILDYVMYTDSVISVEHSFILNPSTMSAAELAATGLIETDMMRTKNLNLFDFDHLPLIVDFSANAVPIILGDCDLNGVADFFDISPFISILTTGSFLAEADCNQDGDVTFLDVAAFIAILAG